MDMSELDMLWAPAAPLQAHAIVPHAHDDVPRPVPATPRPRPRKRPTTPLRSTTKSRRQLAASEARAKRLLYQNHRVAESQALALVRAVEHIDAKGALRKQTLLKVVKAGRRADSMPGREALTRFSKFRLAFVAKRMRKGVGTGQAFTTSSTTMLEVAYAPTCNITALGQRFEMDPHSIRRYQTYIAACYLDCQLKVANLYGRVASMQFAECK